MNQDKKTLTLREQVIMLLSDDETSKVSKAETAPRLSDGEEYLDLEQLSQGVLKAHGEPIAMGRALPKKAVEEKTWASILGLLAGPAAAVTKASHR